MSGGSKQEQLEHRLDHKLNASSDGIDMDVPAKVISSETVYTGRIFHVDDMRIALTDKQGKEHEIGRQVLRHAPCVVMLVHDMSTDRYLIEREYRAGSDMFAYGLPAGLMDEGEDIMDAALRELAEETGVVPDRALLILFLLTALLLYFLLTTKPNLVGREESFLLFPQ